jgi:hypothetical protein
VQCQLLARHSLCCGIPSLSAQQTSINRTDRSKTNSDQRHRAIPPKKRPAEAGPLLGETPKLLLRALLAGLVVLPALLAALSWVLRLLAGLLVRLPALLLPPWPPC